MKRAITVIIPFLIYILCFSPEGKAQCSQDICLVAPAPADCPSDACVMCSPCLLDGYLGRTLSESNPCNEPVTFCGSIENNQWFAFKAPPSGEVTFHFEIVSCAGTVGGGGIQAQVFSTNDCDSFEPVSACWSPGQASDGSVTAKNLQPFCTYYLMIDGWGGDFCEFIITTSDCNTGPTSPASVSGPTNPCPGETEAYSVQSAAMSGCEAANGTYSWSGIAPLGEIIGPADGPTIMVKWTAPGVATVSATINSECYGARQSSPIAIQIDSIPVTTIELTACEGECVPCAGQMVCEEGPTPVHLTSWRGCDSLVNCYLQWLPPVVNDLGEITLCGQASFEICGQALDACGNYAVTCESWQGCDSTVLVELVFLNPVAMVSQPDTLSCSSNQTVVLDGSGSLAACSKNVVTTYSWSGPPGGVLGPADEVTAAASLPGGYCLTITQNWDGTNCSSVKCITVASSNGLPVLPQIGGASQACVGDTVGYSVLAPGNHVASYQWAVSEGAALASYGATASLHWDSAGAHQICLTATDYCGRSASSCSYVLVSAPPEADAGPDALLDCLKTAVELGGDDPPQGMVLSWTGGIVSDPSAPHPITSEPGSYQLRATDPATGCSATDLTVVSQILDQPLPFISSFGVQCAGGQDGEISIDSIHNGLPPYFHALDGGPFLPQTFFDGLSPGQHTIITKDANGCQQTRQVEIEGPEKLGVSLFLENAGPGNTIELGDSIKVIVMTTPGLDSLDAIVWTPSGGAPCETCTEFWLHPLQTTTYSVVVVKNSCEEEAKATVFVQKKRPVYVPNAFSPNDDGTNDTFFIQAGPGVRRVKSFLIHDRWGARVFQKSDFPPNDPAFGWDGNLRGKPMDAGTFTWQAVVEFIDGEVEKSNGFVSLIR